MEVPLMLYGQLHTLAAAVTAACTALSPESRFMFALPFGIGALALARDALARAFHSHGK
jgi:hypothetical protein